MIKITATTVCGLICTHLYGGLMPRMESDDVLGHEFMGEVVGVGLGRPAR
jgi:threonine dehydrogenase-like Zn-dependent dehydrogenase